MSAATRSASSAGQPGRCRWASTSIYFSHEEFVMLPLLLILPAVMADSFWMTADLLRVDWSEGCLTTAGCSHPRFEIIGDLLLLTEEISISWPISEHFVQDTSRSFVSHWAKGKPEDLKLRCQVVGTDPLYGFPRVCDHTASVRAFPDGDGILERRRRQAMVTTTPLPEEELGKRLIEIRARCFNATVAVEKHTERCPWCPDPLDVTLIEHRLPGDPSSAFSTSIFSRLKSDDKILQASLLTLAAVSILTSMSFACALVALLRQKRSHRQITVKSRCQPYSAPNCKISEEENRYDMPWEQTLPLTYCVSSSSKSTTTSPLDSTSSFGASSSVINPYSFRPGCAIPQTQIYHHISPNSSATAGRDFGLGSI
ncbi:unnamed protein product [Cylicocyclus nassatus]|uniref:C2 domain-containing protein n=1 Tax=Cylicocyclus nassatus TaxID=53992 RepID=A0AA36M4J9_CYLNA|nr:unnamed protein product [Cylicocyclus nassatus]